MMSISDTHPTKSPKVTGYSATIRCTIYTAILQVESKLLQLVHQANVHHSNYEQMAWREIVQSTPHVKRWNQSH
jgi:hypothetical protein